MSSSSAFVGIHLSTARKPLTFALLDQDLSLIQVADGQIEEIGTVLSEPESAIVCVIPRAKPTSTKFAKIFSIFQKQLAELSFQPYSATSAARLWFQSHADEAFRALLQHKLFSRRTLEGRIQRALILYDQGLQIDDPMEFFEEITRYKLMQGILPLEIIHSANELDALAGAYLAWMTANRSQQIRVRGDLILPVQG
ncbi:MAG TPA: hypothetical protein VFO91_17895 [Anaerolineales bacterium]|nr:hypothetical protein [Anaerolineales bacterium]